MKAGEKSTLRYASVAQHIKVKADCVSEAKQHKTLPNKCYPADDI